VGYVILRLVAFLLLLAALLFSFVFVGTALAAPFLEMLSARVERVLQGQDALTPVRPLPWLRDLVRVLGHAFLLLLRLSSWSYSCHWSGWCCCRLQLWGAHCSYWRLTRDTRSEFRLCPPRLRSGARTWWV